jgi:hypothetical protein
MTVDAELRPRPAEHVGIEPGLHNARMMVISWKPVIRLAATPC